MKSRLINTVTRQIVVVKPGNDIPMQDFLYMSGISVSFTGKYRYLSVGDVPVSSDGKVPPNLYSREVYLYDHSGISVSLYPPASRWDVSVGTITIEYDDHQTEEELRQLAESYIERMNTFLIYGTKTLLLYSGITPYLNNNYEDIWTADDASKSANALAAELLTLSGIKSSPEDWIPLEELAAEVLVNTIKTLIDERGDMEGDELLNRIRKLVNAI